jgi:hypothetical protein
MRAIRSISVVAIAIGALTGSAVGATAQQEVTPRPPTEFTGHIECGPEVSHGTDRRESFETDAGRVVRVTSRGWAWQPYQTTMSDPRLEGTYQLAYDSDQVTQAGTSAPAVGSGTWRIVNDDGAWQGSFPIIEFPDHTTTVTTQLEGSGAYEGLTAIWESQHDARACSWEVRGVIIEGQVPAAPEPPAE